MHIGEIFDKLREYLRILLTAEMYLTISVWPLLWASSRGVLHLLLTTLREAPPSTSSWTIRE